MLQGNSSVNMIQHEEAVFSVHPNDAPIDWLDSNHVICVYCRSMSIPWLYKSNRIRSGKLQVVIVAAEARRQASK
jgi:hypothetical protein